MEREQREPKPKNIFDLIEYKNRINPRKEMQRVTMENVVRSNKQVFKKMPNTKSQQCSQKMISI